MINSAGVADLRTSLDLAVMQLPLMSRNTLIVHLFWLQGLVVMPETTGMGEFMDERIRLPPTPTVSAALKRVWRTGNSLEAGAVPPRVISTSHIANEVPADSNDRPTRPVRIQKLTISTSQL
jgi:hypothetical protein